MPSVHLLSVIPLGERTPSSVPEKKSRGVRSVKWEYKVCGPLQPVQCYAQQHSNISILVLVNQNELGCYPVEAT